LKGVAGCSLLLLFAFAFGDSEPPGVWPTPTEWVGIGFFPIGVSLGLLLGWWREAPGGIITLASLSGFYLWHFCVAGRFAAGPWFVLLAAPGVLYLAAASLSASPLVAQSG
jgi:hypothetical protein